MSVVTSRRRRRLKLEGSVTSVSCDLSVTPPVRNWRAVVTTFVPSQFLPPAVTGGQCHY